MPSAQPQNHNLFHYLLTALGGIVKGTAGAVSWGFLSLAGFLIFSLKRPPLDIIIGLPFILLGAGLAVQQAWEGVASIFPKFNRLHCKLCQES